MPTHHSGSSAYRGVQPLDRMGILRSGAADGEDGFGGDMGRVRNTGVVSFPAVMHIEENVRNFLGLLVFLGHRRSKILVSSSNSGRWTLLIRWRPFGQHSLPLFCGEAGFPDSASDASSSSGAFYNRPEVKGGKKQLLSGIEVEKGFL